MKAVKLLLPFLFMIHFTHAQDWADLKHFQQENKSLGLPKPNENRVVFMGNSITIGWKDARPAFFKGKNFVNRGISGQTTPQMLVRFRQDVIDLKPKVVVILAGINDIAGNTGPATQKMIEDNIACMAELAKANGIGVILCSVLPAYDFSWRPGLEPAQKIISLNRWIKGYAKKQGHGFVDYHSAMTNNKGGMLAQYADDGVHPNQKGYEIMEPLLEAAIKKALR